MESGTIINIASVAGITAGLSSHPYTAAKWGVVGLTKSVALELAERGIRVNAICPGGTATWIWAPVYPEMSADMSERTPEIVEPWLAAGAPLGRAGFPADIANAALWLASSESSFVTGHALVESFIPRKGVSQQILTDLFPLRILGRIGQALVAA